MAFSTEALMIQNQRFVRMVKDNPVLYNPNHPGYARKGLCEAAWQKIGTRFGMTPEKCKWKWRNLRTVMGRHLKFKKQKDPKRYYLYKEMEFAIPFIKTLKTPDSESPLRKVPKTEPETVFCSEFEEEPEEPRNESPDSLFSSTAQPLHENPTFQPNPLPDPGSDPEESLLSQHAGKNQIELENVRYFTHKSKLSIPEPDSDESEEETDHYFGPQKKRTKLIECGPELDLIKESKKRFLLSLLPDVYAMNYSQMTRFRLDTLTLIDKIMSCNSGESTNKTNNSN